MEILEFEQTDPATYRMRIKIAADTLAKEYEKVLSELIPDTDVPGFRAGKAPRKMVERHIGVDEIWRMARDSAAQEAFEKALKEKETSCVGEPDYQHTDYTGEGDYEVVIVYHAESQEPAKRDRKEEPSDGKGPDEHIPEKPKREPTEDHERLAKAGPAAEHVKRGIEKQRGRRANPSIPNPKHKIPGQRNK